jgi:hypothetical protein
VWTNPIIDGPLPAPWAESPALDEQILGPDSPHLFGTIQIGAQRVGCIVMGFKWTSDWLAVAIPTGMLDLLGPLRHPVHDVANYWLHDVERALVNLADTVNYAVPFDLGVLGEEAITMAPGGEGSPMTREAVEETGGYVLSEQVWHELALTQRSEVLPSGLRWVPSKVFAGPSV